MWSQASSGREFEVGFTTGYHYKVRGTAEPVAGPSRGARCASQNPTLLQKGRVGKGLTI